MALKLSPHVLASSRHGDVPRRWLELLHSPIVVLAGDYAFAEDYAALGAKVIGRVVTDWWSLSEQAVKPPDYAAAEYLEFVSEHILANPGVAYWAGPNEPVPAESQPSDLIRIYQWYSQFEAARIQQLSEKFGKRAVWGQFSVGTPDLPENNRCEYLSQMAEAVAASFEHGALLGLHEYSGMEDMENWSSWLFFRYRWWASLYPGLPIVITECGSDRLQNGGDVPHRAFAFAQEGIFDEWAYARWLYWEYERGLQLDDAVVGAAVFTVGAEAGPFVGFEVGHEFVSALGSFDSAARQAERERLSEKDYYFRRKVNLE